MTLSSEGATEAGAIAIQMPDIISPIRAVVFDLDDTLFPEWQYVHSGYRAVGGHLRQSLGREDRFEEWLWQRFQRGQAAGAFDALNEHFHLRLGGEQIASLVKVYRGHRPTLRPFDGVGGMLSLLHGNFRLGLLSDGYLPAQRLKLEATGLQRFFDAVVFTEELGRQAWKPSTTGFEKISRMLDTPHSRCAYVADNIVKDFIAPNALGWRTIQFLRPGQVYANVVGGPEAQPQFSVRLPGDLLAALVERA